MEFPKIIQLEVKTRLKEGDLREVRIVLQGTGYRIEIENIQAKENRKVMDIDFGIRNAVTIAGSIGNTPIAIKGGALNSVNQYFNKENARLKSISDR